MNIKEINKFLDTLTEPKFAIMFSGAHGIGKSDVVRQWAQRKNFFFIDLRLGQKDVGDIVGYPQVINGRFVHILPDLLAPAFAPNPPDGYDGVVLFLDELNRGTKDVIQAAFQLVLDRVMNGQKLHPNCWVFSAINDNMDIYTVTDLDPAMRNRFMLIEFQPTVDEWLAWAEGRNANDKRNIDIDIRNFIVTFKEYLETKMTSDLAESGGVHPTRRTWHMYSKWYVENKSALSIPFLTTIAESFVGKSAAGAFKLYVTEKGQLIEDSEEAVAQKVERKHAKRGEHSFQEKLVKTLNGVNARSSKTLDAGTGTMQDGFSLFYKSNIDSITNLITENIGEGLQSTEMVVNNLYKWFTSRNKITTKQGIVLGLLYKALPEEVFQLLIAEMRKGGIYFATKRKTPFGLMNWGG
jgi:hypothetical protein